MALCIMMYINYLVINYYVVLGLRSFIFFIINVGVRANLRIPRLILRTLKLSII
jgi:hypothetical protein